MGKRDLILDMIQELPKEQRGANCSVRDIAERTGIAKGRMYYYFKSKEEAFDALVERACQGIISDCHKIADMPGIMQWRSWRSFIGITAAPLSLPAGFLSPSAAEC